MLFRKHRRSLKESLKTTVSISPTIESLFNEIKKDFIGELNIEDIKIKYYAYDKRISQNTYIVYNENGVFGFTDIIPTDYVEK